MKRALCPLNTTISHIYPSLQQLCVECTVQGCVIVSVLIQRRVGTDGCVSLTCSRVHFPSTAV